MDLSDSLPRDIHSTSEVQDTSNINVDYYYYKTRRYAFIKFVLLSYVSDQLEMSGFEDSLMQPINYKIYNNENARKLNVYWSLNKFNKYTFV